jgi:hypothetical protein
VKNRTLIQKLLEDLKLLEHQIFNLLSSKDDEIQSIQGKIKQRGSVISILLKYQNQIKSCRETNKTLQLFLKNNLIIEKRLEEKKEVIKKDLINIKKAHLIHKSYGQQNGK